MGIARCPVYFLNRLFLDETCLDFNIKKVQQVCPPLLLWILEIGAHTDRLAAELLDLTEGGAVYVARHVVVQLERVLYAERALGL